MDQLQLLERDLDAEESNATPRGLARPPVAAPIASSPVATKADSPLERRFAGFTYAQLIAGALALAAVVWGMWATSKIFALEDRRVVSVRLAAIVNDFVTAEARSGTPPEQLAGRTRTFMTALDGVLKARAANGEVVLVGEAVVASSVPDVTNEVVADLAKVVKLAAPVAMPPAVAPRITPPASGQPQTVPVPVPGLAPAADGGGDPFGGAGAPVDGAPQP